MSKPSKAKMPAFTPMIHNTMDTAAYQSLSPVAECLYLRLKRRAGYNGDRNGRLFYSVREAADDLGCHQDTVRTAFYLLQARGFIVPTQIGALGVAGEGKATTWRLTELGTPQNARPSKEYVNWTSGNDFPVKRGKSPANQKQNPALNFRPPCPNFTGVSAEPAPIFRAACPNLRAFWPKLRPSLPQSLGHLRIAMRRGVSDGGRYQVRIDLRRAASRVLSRRRGDHR